MDRATKVVETAGGHKATIHTYITAGEAQALAAFVPENPTTTQQIEANNKAVAHMLLDLDGDKENIGTRMLELPIKDFREINDAVQELVETDKKK